MNDVSKIGQGWCPTFTLLFRIYKCCELLANDFIFPRNPLSLKYSIIITSFHVYLISVDDSTMAEERLDKIVPSVVYKPHTMYDQVLEQLDNEFSMPALEEVELERDEDVEEEDAYDEDINEIIPNKETKRKIKKLKRRKSYIYQNLYKKKDTKTNLRD